MTKKRQGKKTLEEKMYDLDENFASEVRAGTAEFIKDKLVKISRHEEEITEAKKNDPSLMTLKEELKTANETYSEPLKAIKIKKAFILKVLADKGQG